MEDSDCLFCQISKKQIPSEIIWESDEAIAFRDIAPQAPQHILVIPRQHIKSLSDISEIEAQLMGELVLAVVEIARKLGLESGYRMVVNCGPDGGQAVDHIHFHLLGERKMTWPPG